MDHESTREMLEVAALEPDGLDRLMAGDTATAQAVAGHLAGCPSCTDELIRLQRVSSVIRSVVREMPSPELRERTLATVAAIGVPRGEAGFVLRSGSAGRDSDPSRGPDAGLAAASVGGAGAVAGPERVAGGMAAAQAMPVAGATPAGEPDGAVAASSGTAGSTSRSREARAGRRNLLRWVAAIAAAVVLSVASTLLIVEARFSDRLAAQSRSLGALADATIAAMSITAQPDAALVTLAGTTDPGPAGRLSFSPSTRQVVLVANGLDEPAAGQEYRAWVEVDGKRQRVGRLTFSDGVAYWSGPADAVAGLQGNARFGVSLVDSNASGGTPPPVMLGEY